MRNDCEACGTTDYQPVYLARRHTDIVACTSCGLTWNRAMLASDAQAYYESDYRSEFHDDLNANGFTRTFLVSMLTRAACLHEFLGDDLTPGTRHLDVGCGEGTFLAFSRDRGAKTTGMELDDRLTRFAKQRYGLTVHRGTLDHVKLPVGGYDLVSLVHVVEHLTHPIDTLRQVKPLLASGGRLLIEVPNLSRPWQKPRTFFFREHSFYFTVQTLQRIVALAGFQPVRVAESRRDGSVQLLAQLAEKPAVRDEWRNTPADVRSAIVRNQLSYYLGLRFLRNKVHRLRMKNWALQHHGHLLSPSLHDKLPTFKRAA